MGLRFNPTTQKLDLVNSSTGGASAFTDLTDAPSTYTGQTGKQVVVKTTEDGLEFVSAVQAFDGGTHFDTYINTVNFDGGSH